MIAGKPEFPYKIRIKFFTINSKKVNTHLSLN